MMLELTQLSSQQIASANLMTAIQVECPRSNANSNDLASEGECREVFSFSDDFLPDNPVFVMRIRESYRLRITLVHDRMAQIPIRRVVGVRVQLPEQETDALAGEQSNETLFTEQISFDTEKCEAIALLDPILLNYTRLLTLSPMTGEIDEKYVRLDLVITVSLSVEATQTFDLKHRIYCQIVSPDHRSNMQKFVRRCRKQWERFPQWMRDGARASVFFASLTLGCH